MEAGRGWSAGWLAGWDEDRRGRYGAGDDVTLAQRMAEGRGCGHGSALSVLGPRGACIGRVGALEACWVL